MLFFEQRARPPEVACPCSKNKGHTRIKSFTLFLKIVATAGFTC